MALSVAPYLKPAPVYRLGLYGGTSAGKTTFLAALGLGAGRSSPAGYTCVRQTRLPAKAQPPGTPESWLPEELRRDPLKAFMRGDLWIKAAECQLHDCKQVEANAGAIPPLLLVYELTAPDHGQLTIEVSDFAGELLRPQNRALQNAQILEDRLREVDALLILAEAPHRGQESDALTEELRLLQETILEWTRSRKQGAKLTTPVALLFNKWDRRGSPGATAKERQQEIDELLAQAPGHRGLLNTLQNVAQNLAVFAVSAFGQHQTEKDDAGRPQPLKDRPAAYPLSSFGLEDGLVWACQRADAVTRHSLEESERSRQAFRFWNVGHTWRLWNVADQYARRLPPGPKLDEAQLLRRQSGRAFILQSMTLLFMFLLPSLIIERQVDAHRHGSAERVLADPTATPTALATEWDWLANYAESAWPRHALYRMAFTPKEAAALRQASVQVREEPHWQHILNTKDDKLRLELLKRFITEFANGAHAAEALSEYTALALRLKRAEQVEANDRALSAVRLGMGSTGGENSRAALEQLLKSFQALPPHPEAESTEDRHRREKLGVDIHEALQSIGKEEDLTRWLRKKQEIVREIDNLELARAAQLLREYPKASPEVQQQVQQQRADFPADAIRSAKRHLQSMDERAEYGPLAQLESALADRDFQALMTGKHLNEMSPIKRSMELRRERALYNDFRSDPSETRAQAYRKIVKDGVMKEHVASYLKWLHARESEEQTIQIVIDEVGWNEWYNHDTVRLQMYVELVKDGGEYPILNAVTPSKKSQKSGPFESVEFPRVLSKPFKLRLNIDTEGGLIQWWTDRLRANLIFESITATELNESFKEVTMTQGSRRGTTVRFSVRGIPEPPDLPEWKD